MVHFYGHCNGGSFTSDDKIYSLTDKFGSFLKILLYYLIYFWTSKLSYKFYFNEVTDYFIR